MSDVAAANVLGVSDGERQNGERSAGEMMRVAREAAGLHVAALAVAMKIPVKKLEALESDRLDLLHDAVFVRALASSVCRTLKIDPTPVLAKLPSTTTPRLNSDERGINAPFHKAGDTVGVSFSSLLAKPTTLIVLTLLVGVLVVYFFPDIKVSETAAELMASQPKPVESDVPTPVTKPIIELEAASPQQVAPAPEVAGGIRTASPVQAVPLSPVASTSSPVVGPAMGIANSLPIERVAVSPTGASVPKDGIVAFKAKAVSWVSVVDAKGNVVLSKTMVQGEAISVTGELPLAVVVGRSDAMDVEVRGKAFGLAGVAKENVARFEVR